MAVYAAHLARPLGGAPSVFQLAAQDALGATLKPALRRLFQYLAAVYPDKCGWTERWFDELYLLFDGSLQYHYLKHYAASFSESFYGLLRVPINSNSEFSPGTRLPAPLERASLALLVLAPYVRDKVERVIERWREQDEDGALGKSPSDQARKAAIKVYSIAHLAIECVKLFQLGAYICGRARSHSPALAAAGLTLKDAPPPGAEPDEYTWGDLVNSLRTGNIRNAMVTFPMVGGALLRGAQYGAFLVQFLRWWDARGAVADSLPPPPPPTRDERSVRWSNKCPVCLQPWRIPTVLPVSGFVFCYVCISREVRAAGRCPVTGLPASDRTLVRLYVDT